MRKRLERTSVEEYRALSLGRKKKYAFTLSWIILVPITCYKIKVIRERRMREEIENERVRSNFCLYMCLITNRTSPIYRYNMVTQKGYKIK